MNLVEQLYTSHVLPDPERQLLCDSAARTLIQYEDELQLLRRFYELVDHTILAEKLGDRYFICGEGGDKDANNLPETIHVCPAYGCDWFQVYKKTDQTHGPEW